MSAHAIEIESKPGRAPRPVWSRWWCSSCGAGRKSYALHARTVREVFAHEEVGASPKEQR